MWIPEDPEQLKQDHIDRVPLQDLVVKHKGTKDQIRGYLKREGLWIPYKRGKINLPEDEIVTLYLQDVDIETLAKRYNVSTGPIVSILKKYDCRKPLWLKHLSFSKIKKLLDTNYFSQAVEKYVGLHPLMEGLGVGENLIRKLCDYHNITLPSNSGLVRSIRNRRKNNSVPLTKDEFEIQHFKYNKSIQDIANEMGISTGYLRQKINHWGVTTRDTRISLEFRKFKKKSKKEIQHLVNTIPVTALHKEYKVSYDLFRKYLNDLQINIPTRYVSSGEKSIGDFFESLSIDVERNNRTLIYPYEIDIFIPSLNIAIEYCGLYWHSEMNNRGRKYHLEKLNRCKKKGIRLITIFEDEYIDNQQIVLSKLENIVGVAKNTNINARDCYIKEISNQLKKDFLNNNHLQGNDISSIRLGLFTNQDILVAVMTFAKPSRSRTSNKIMKKKGLWELNRFATDINYNVRGAAGKLLSYFKRNFEWNEIYSYADKRWSDGNLYSVLGFEHSSDSPPNYWYVPKGYYKREYRYNYTKYRLVEQGFDKNKSEKQIMKERGYTRIWDCGAMKYVIKKEA